MLNDLTQILKFKSVQEPPDAHAPFGPALKQTLDWFLDRASSYGLKTENLDGYCGYAEYGEGKELFGILCHLDVVPAGEGWSCPPYALTEKDGFLYGRGVVDNKGPAIVMLHVLKTLKERNVTLKHRIRLIAGCNEETGGACMRYYTEHAELPSMSVVPDADFPVINSEKGILQTRLSVKVSKTFQQNIRRLKFGDRANVVPDAAEATLTDGRIIKTQGRAGHAMSPEKADNAAYKLFDTLKDTAHECRAILEILCKSDGSGLGIACKDAQSGALTINLGAGDYDGGQTDGNLNLTLDMRLPLSLKLDAAIAALQKAFPHGTVQILHHQPNLYFDPDNRLIQTLLHVYERITGQSATPKQTGGGTYARLLPQAAAFGPTFPDTETFIHDADERIRKEQFQKWFDIYYAAVQEFDKL